MNGQKEVRKIVARLHKTYGSIAPLGVNCYYCFCGHVTKTVDIHAGVTPMMFPCEKCGTSARSSFYKEIAPGAEPTIEFYRPDEAELIKLKKKDKLMYEHVCMGGLINRKIQQNGDIQNGGESIQGAGTATKD